jgi:hypothetical protein
MQNHPHNLPPAAQRPWYLEPWPWLLMLGPVIVMIAGFHTAWIAFSQQDALVVDDYYKQGKAINRDLRRDSAASRLGMAAALRYDANAGTLTGSVTRTQPAQPAQPAQPSAGPAAAAGATPVAASAPTPLVLRLIHSTLPARDRTYRVTPDAAGHFAVSVPLLEISHWQVMLESEDGVWRLNGPWQWPQQKSIVLNAQ